MRHLREHLDTEQRRWQEVDHRLGEAVALLAEGLRRARGRDRGTLELVGRADLGPDEVQAIRDVLARCGARAAVEAGIAARVARADAALAAAPVTGTGRATLEELARRCMVRDA